VAALASPIAIHKRYKSTCILLEKAINMASSDAIKAQIEFYFSDSNFRKDNFLKTSASQDKEGFVPIKVLLTFNKLKSLTLDESAIANACLGSTVVDVSDDKLKIKRKVPLSSEDTSRSRTLYVKGFPLNDESITIDYIKSQFHKYGTILMVRLRKDNKKAFKGSCFIEYDNEDSVATAVTDAYEADGKTVKLKNSKDELFLCVMKFDHWYANKEAKRKRRKEQAKRKLDKPDESKPNKKSKKENDDDSESDGEDDNETKAILQNSDIKVQFTPGLLIKFTDIPTDSDTYAIKALLQAHGDVKFVQIDNEKHEAIVRVGDNATSAAILAAVAKGLPLTAGGTNSTANALTGDDEEAFYKKFAAERQKNDKAKASKSKGGRGGGKFKKGGRGGRGGKFKKGGRGGRGGRGKR